MVLYRKAYLIVTQSVATFSIKSGPAPNTFTFKSCKPNRNRNFPSPPWTQLGGFSPYQANQGKPSQHSNIMPHDNWIMKHHFAVCVNHKRIKFALMKNYADDVQVQTSD